MTLRSVILTTVLVLLASNSSAWARKWSDTSGNTMEANFVRVHNGNIVLQGGGRVVMVPFGDFVPEDQEYLRKELEKKGQAHLLPAVPRSAPSSDGGGEAGESSGSSGGEGARPPGIQRIWTDVDGRKIRASLVRAEGDDVVLLMDGKEFTVPLKRLSRVDQMYVTTVSKVAQTPRPPAGQPSFPGSMPEMPRGPGAAQFPRGNSGRGYGGRGNMYGSGYGYSPDESEMDYSGEEESGSYDEETMYEEEESYDEEESGDDEESMYDDEEESYDEEETYDEQEGSYDEENMDEEEESYDEEEGSYAEEESSSHGGESYASNMPGGPPGSSRPGSSAPPYAGGPSSPGYSPPSHAPNFPQSSMPSMPVMEEVGECSNCGKEVSGDYGAGDHCPHCNVYFEYEEDEYGNTTAADGSSGSSNFNISGRGIRGLVKLAIFIGIGVVSACGWAARKIFGS